MIAHSDKEDAAPTWRRTYGHHPLMGFVDHGPGGTGEPVVPLLRPGNVGSNAAADHIRATQLTPAQLPRKYRRVREDDPPSLRTLAVGIDRDLQAVTAGLALPGNSGPTDSP